MGATKVHNEHCPARGRRRDVPSSSSLTKHKSALALLLLVILLALCGLAVRYWVFAATTGQSGVLAYAEALCVWDCAWYRTIVETGYDLYPAGAFRPEAANWAFFPLYPLIAFLLRAATGLPTSLVGMVLSSCFTVATILAARPLFARRSAFWMFAFLLTNGPFAVIYSTLYTESLFMLLTVLCLVRLERGDTLGAGIFAGLLSATRVTGIVMAPTMLVEVIRRHLLQGGRWSGVPRAIFEDSRVLLGLGLAPLGALLYMAYLYFLVGDALGFAHIQRAWNRDFGNPLPGLWSALFPADIMNPGSMVSASWAIVGVLGLVLCLFLAWRRWWAGALFATLALVLSLASGVGSMIRFVAGLAPLNIAIARILSANRIIMVLSLPALVWMGTLVTTGWMRSSLFLM